MAGHIVLNESTDTIGVMRGSLLVLIAVCLLPVGALVAADVVSTWNGTTGNWTDFARWSSDPLYPSSGNGGFTYDATINAGNVTQDVAGGIMIEQLTFGGGAITGDYELTVNGLFTWTGGTMIGTGTTYANGGMLLSGGTEMKERTLVNAGLAVWSAGDLEWRSDWQRPAPQFNNISGATFEIRTDGTVYRSGPPYAVPVIFNNSGSVVKLSSTGTTAFNGTFNNTGAVEVQTGTLKFARAFSQTGDGVTAVHPGAALEGANFSANRIINNGTITSKGSMTIGDPTTCDGYSGTGKVDAGGKTITLTSPGRAT
ncbi:hypothetical protein LCGC14_2045530 [marine sediment metagenome]|uniref:Uncharacterized protein n=1 Tax=marine sediment metagenome TaxID=412755 RepID=A0A0F9HMJ2_9ZZZZ